MADLIIESSEAALSISSWIFDAFPCSCLLYTSSRAIKLEGQNSFGEIAQSCVEKILLKVIDGVHTGKKQKYSWLTPKRIAEYYAQSMCYVVISWIQSGMTISAKELAEIYDYIIKRSMDDIIAEM